MNHRVSPKAGVRRTHAERSAATRQHLIATAIDVIQHRSLEEMSIHELARSAGMTSGAASNASATASACSAGTAISNPSSPV